MFTGIVETTGTIVASRPEAGGRRLRVETEELAGSVATGASMCVSGVCLTVATCEPGALEFDVIRETLDKSTLGSKRVGDRVNLERSLRVGDRLDGHFVQGHVDGTAVVDHVRNTAREHVIGLRLETSLMPYIIPKGSVTLDGVSLTVASVERTGFSVALIPTTLERTTLSNMAVGAKINIETDILARTVLHQLTGLREGSGLTAEALRKAGFA